MYNVLSDVMHIDLDRAITVFIESSGINLGNTFVCHTDWLPNKTHRVTKVHAGLLSIQFKYKLAGF